MTKTHWKTLLTYVLLYSVTGDIIEKLSHLFPDELLLAALDLIDRECGKPAPPMAFLVPKLALIRHEFVLNQSYGIPQHGVITIITFTARRRLIPSFRPSPNHQRLQRSVPAQRSRRPSFRWIRISWFVSLLITFIHSYTLLTRSVPYHSVNIYWRCGLRIVLENSSRSRSGLMTLWPCLKRNHDVYLHIPSVR